MKYKHLLQVFFIILLFSSCSEIADKDINISNPVEGEWNSFSDSGMLLQKKIYTSNFYTYFLIIDGEPISNPDMQHYSIANGDKLIFDRYTQTFVISNDTLWLTNSSQSKTTKYIRHQQMIN